MSFKKFATAKFILSVNSADYISSVRYRYDLISSFSSWVLTRIPARTVDANTRRIRIEVYGSSCSHRLQYCECNFNRLKEEFDRYIWLWRLLMLQLNSSNWWRLKYITVWVKSIALFLKKCRKRTQLND